MIRRTPLALWVAVPLLSAAPVASGLRQSARADEGFARTGVLGSFRLDMDGTLFLRIDHEAAKRPGGGEESQTSTWFITPPDRNAQIRVEEMLMELALQQTGAEDEDKRPVTIQGKIERTLDGTTPEQAIPILAVES